MPFTAFHPVVVWPLWKRAPQRLDFVALTVGATIPDLLEVLFVYLLPDYYWTHREWSHSLLGAVTYDLGVALIATVLVVRPLLFWLDRIHPSPLWSQYGGHEFREARPFPVMALSATVGALSHVLVDIPFHPESPLLFPLFPALQVVPHSQLWTVGNLSAILFGSLFLYLLYVNWWRPAHPRARATVK
ncbi:MAG TPA: DUF4184 family protein [Thermoplasmata archaeon]|nr:DUF4184 family protein [Thermoplasmata archaeon]